MQAAERERADVLPMASPELQHGSSPLPPCRGFEEKLPVLEYDGVRVCSVGTTGKSAYDGAQCLSAPTGKAEFLQSMTAGDG